MRTSVLAAALLVLGPIAGGCGPDETPSGNPPGQAERSEEVVARSRFFAKVREADKARRDGDLERAVTLYRKALEWNAEHEGCLVDLARSLRELGRPKEALEVLARLNTLRPELPRPHFLMAEILSEDPEASDRDLERAAEFYRAALSIEPNVSGPRLGLARLQRRRRLIPAAEEAYRMVLGTNPDSHEALTGLGLVLLDRGVPAEAIPYLVRALEVGTRAKGRRDVPSEMDTASSFDAGKLDSPANRKAHEALTRAARALGAYPEDVPERFRVDLGPR